MATAWAIIVIILSTLAWGGQAISWLSPRTAERLSLSEPESTVDPAFHADGRGEAIWDTLTLWVTIVAGALLLLGNDAWAYFGLAGGTVYLYFAGRGLLARHAIQGSGLRIGNEQSVKTARLFLAIWGAMGLVTLIASSVALASG